MERLAMLRGFVVKINRIYNYNLKNINKCVKAFHHFILYDVNFNY